MALHSPIKVQSRSVYTKCVIDTLASTSAMRRVLWAKHGEVTSK